MTVILQMWKLRPREFKTDDITASQWQSKDLNPQLMLLISRHSNITSVFCPHKTLGSEFAHKDALPSFLKN